MQGVEDPADPVMMGSLARIVCFYYFAARGSLYKVICA